VSLPRSYAAPVSFFFGQFELDPTTYKLRRGGQELPLQPKIFDAIRYLLENRNRVVRKEELLDALWPGQHVNETAVPWTISRARKAIGQDNQENHPIETVRGRGYRFTGEVREVTQNDAGETAAATSSPPASVVPAAPSTVRPSAPRLANDPFVGRAEVIERLFGALHGASSGRGRLCLVTGEAGIGKTRCMNEFAMISRRLKRSVWSGRCLEGGRTAVFWPWVQVLRDALAQGQLSAALQLETRALLAELTPRGDNGEPPSAGGAAASPAVPRRQDLDVGASSAVAARFWTLEKLSRFLLRCAETAPRVVLLDDVHWADEASLDLLVFLAAELPRMSALVIATARDAELHHSEAWSKALTRLGPCERIELSGLRSSDVEQYVAEVTGLELPPEIPRTVHSKCGGNPLFMQETVRLLSARCERIGVQALRTDDISVPGVARDVLRARLTGLGDEPREALEVACIIGQEFELVVLRSVLGIPADKLLAALDQASRAHLIAPRARGGTYGFSHDTIREALYEELSTARRAELHTRVAQALEGRAAGEHRVNDLAYHYFRALPQADPARAERFARLAADGAMQAYAYEDAAQFYAWALEAQRFREDADPRSSCQLLLDLGTAQRLSGQIADSRKAFSRVITLAQQHAFADVLSQAARRLRPSPSVALIPDPLVLKAVEEAARLLPEAGESSLRIRVLGQLACIPPYSLSMEKSRELSKQAVKLARETGNRDDLIEALKNSLHALSGPDDIDELLATTNEIVELHPLQAIHIGFSRYHALLLKGDMAGAGQTLQELGEVSHTSRYREGLWHCERLRAQRAFNEGEFEKAESAFREMFVEARRLRLPYGKRFFIVHTIALAQERAVLTGLPFTDREFQSELDWVPLPSYRAHEARLMFDLGRPRDARERFEEIARAGFENIPRDLNLLNTLAVLTTVAVALDDRNRAEALYALMRAYPKLNTPNGFGMCLGSVSYFLGKLAQLLGRPKDAATHFEDALVTNAAWGYVPHLARTQLALGELFAEEGGRATRQRANALLAEGMETARKLDMAPLLGEGERLRERLAPAGGTSRAR
jgi:DNA-binding winged helix-turn-helix (wHTH) protein/tetratricopeptide (TPR) repeat protein